MLADLAKLVCEARAERPIELSSRMKKGEYKQDEMEAQLNYENDKVNATMNNRREGERASALCPSPAGKSCSMLYVGVVREVHAKLCALSWGGHPLKRIRVLLLPPPSPSRAQFSPGGVPVVILVGATP